MTCRSGSTRPSAARTSEGLALAALLEVLRYAVLLGALPHRSALAAVDRHLAGLGVGRP